MGFTTVVEINVAIRNIANTENRNATTKQLNSPKWKNHLGLR